MDKPLTLGSLFDGIGGFCLAGQYAGIRPVWVSEIEPFPMRVTEMRFPDVVQLGDVHAIHGGSIPPVDVITFGSPCQNLSIAGKRTGLSGEQSSLFFEAVRIISEMRKHTNGQYPRWAVWENVPGALSSNNGNDFREVLQSLAQIADRSADVPMPPLGKWLSAGEIMGNHYSLAWRIIDAAKGWGVAQRRRRIFAIVDFAGTSAGEILFESEGLSGYSPPGGKAREGTADDPSACAGASGFCINNSANSRGVGCSAEKAPTLRSYPAHGVAIEHHPLDSRIKVKEDGICQTLSARCGTGGNNVPLTLNAIAYGISSDQSNAMLSDNPHSGVYVADTSRTLDTAGGNPACNQGGMAIVESYAIQGSMIGRKDKNGPQGDGVNKEVSFTLNTIDRHAVYAMNMGLYTTYHEKTPPLMARDWKDPPILNKEESAYLVRRLTPDECCRLQGYPDGWCHGLESETPAAHEIAVWKERFALWDQIQGRQRPRTEKEIIKWLKSPNTDAAEYKAYGNSVAVPCVFFVLAGIAWAAKKEEPK